MSMSDNEFSPIWWSIHLLEHEKFISFLNMINVLMGRYQWGSTTNFLFLFLKKKRREVQLPLRIEIHENTAN